MNIERDMRLEAVKAATRVSVEGEGVHNFLAYVEWITRFVMTGKLPELDKVTDS